MGEVIIISTGQKCLCYFFLQISYFNLSYNGWALVTITYLPVSPLLRIQNQLLQELIFRIDV
jgi:hypothetical protein